MKRFRQGCIFIKFEKEGKNYEKIKESDDVLCLACLVPLVSCGNDKPIEKSEGELLAEGFNANAYIDMNDMVVSDKFELTSGSIVSDIAAGIQTGIASLMSKKPDTFVAWATSSIFKLIFNVQGEDQSKKILDTLSGIEDKMSEINKKLDQIILMLDSLMEKQELSALKDDINTLRSSNAYLQTYIDYTSESYPTRI